MRMQDQWEAEKNNLIYRVKLQEYMSGHISDRVRRETEQLLQMVAADAFMEGWLAAGGASPYIIRSGSPADQTPPAKK